MLVKRSFLLVWLLGCTTLAQTATLLDYKHLVLKTAEMDQPKGSKTVLAKDIIGHRFLLNLKDFNGGDAGYYVAIKDRISFTCAKKSNTFRGGLLEATIVDHHMGDGTNHVFVLDNCSNKNA